MERWLENEFGASGRLEQVEDGVFIEHCEPEQERFFEEDDEDGLLFGAAEGDTAVEPAADDLIGNIMEALRDIWLQEEMRGSISYLPEACGMSRMDMAYLIGELPYRSEFLQKATLEDLAMTLAEDGSVLCYIQSQLLTGFFHDFLLCGVDCLVVVRGIDLRDFENPKVYIAGIGQQLGAAAYPLETFMKAWSFGENSCCLIFRE